MKRSIPILLSAIAMVFAIVWAPANSLATNEASIDDAEAVSVEQIVAEVLTYCDEDTDGSEYQKAWYLHDWLIGQVEHTDSAEANSVESALVDGVGTSQAYAAAYSKLLTAAGIDNTTITNTADNSVWNAVKIDGKWYQVDAFNDADPDAYYDFDQIHLYFGLTDELMALAHPGHKTTYKADNYATRSTSLENNYYVRNGEAAEWAAGYEKSILEQINKGKTEFNIDVDYDVYPLEESCSQSVKGILNGVVAYSLSQTRWNSNNGDVNLECSYDSDSDTFAFSIKRDTAEESDKGTASQSGEQSQSQGQDKDKSSSSQNTDQSKSTDQSKAQNQNQSQSQNNMNSWRYKNGQLSISDNYGNLGGKNGKSLFSSGKTVVAKGIDVSEHQGWINWNAVKNSGQVDFAILRVGYGDNYTFQDDAQWARNVSECERLGIPYGVYIYSYAQSYGQINSEVAHVKRLLSGHKPSYPVYIDMEDSSTLYLGRSTLTQFAKSFCNQINNAGYTAGVYANLNWWNNYLYASQLDNYDRWVAQYNSSCWYDGDYSLWQYSSSGRVSGISGNVDMNYCYTNFGEDVSSAKVKYSTHVQDIGWMQYRGDGSTSGTTGQSKRLEGIKIELGSPVTSKYSGSIQYKTHIQNIGWESGWKSNGALSGTTGRSLRLEAIQIKLTGELANKYDIYYRVHAQNFGWLGWAKNGASAGTEGYAYRLEAIQIQLVAKGGSAPGSTSNTFKKAQIKYNTHIQNVGWQGDIYNGSTSGTTGQSKRLEGIKIELGSPVTSKYSGSIQYKTHIQNIGWESGWKSNGALSGTTGRSLRLEAIQIKLTGELANKYDIYYRVHAQNFGWLGWAKNGASAGTEGYSYRLEAIQIQLVAKGGSAPGSTSNTFKKAQIKYNAHIQDVGWQGDIYNGSTSGTTGQSKRLEGIKIELGSPVTSKYSGSIQYKTHIQNIGWESGWKSNGALSGTTGRSLRLEAIQIKLTGELANKYDIYYRVHAQEFGWLGWAKNGESAGTQGYSYRLEAIQIQLVAKGGSAPGSTSNTFYKH